jgi:hypothetical protein
MVVQNSSAGPGVRRPATPTMRCRSETRLFAVSAMALPNLRFFMSILSLDGNSLPG